VRTQKSVRSLFYSPDVLSTIVFFWIHFVEKHVNADGLPLGLSNLISLTPVPMTVIHKLSGSVLLEKVTEAQVVKEHPAFFAIWKSASSHTTEATLKPRTDIVRR